MTARQHMFRRAKELKLFGNHQYVRVGKDALIAIIEHEAMHAPSSLPECFGKRTSLSHDKTCLACPVQIMCLHRLAHVALPAAAAQAESFERARVAKQMELHEDDIYIAETMARITGNLSGRQANAPIKMRKKRTHGSDAARYMRERMRHPELSKLPPGTKLYREFDGIRHCVTIEDGHYALDGERHPTLFSAGEAITGRHTMKGREHQSPCGVWSVRKFFGKAIEEAVASVR